MPLLHRFYHPTSQQDDILSSLCSRICALLNWPPPLFALFFFQLALWPNCDFGPKRVLQKRIAAVQNSNIRGLFLKVNALSCWKHKTYLFIQPCHFSFLIWGTGAPSLQSTSPYSVSYRTNLTSMKTFAAMLMFKSISFRISQHIDIVLKS